MRRIVWAFIILSPVIAYTQNHWWSALSGSPDTQLAHSIVTTASVKVADAVHAIQTFLS
jgi:hypothetical protein